MFLNLEQSSVMEKMPPPDSLRGTPTVGQYRNDDDDEFKESEFAKESCCDGIKAD